MKTLKGFVRQMARPEGSMAEGWLIQESLVYITEYLSASDPEIPRLWSQESNRRVIGEEPQGQGIKRKMDNNLREKINKFCILNSHVMEKWIETYEALKRQRVQDRLSFRRNRTTRNLPYPEGMQALPDFPTVRWLEATILEAKRAGLTITEEEEELTKGCDWHVSV